MDDWLRNMGDWNISRKRYFGLPLPFYPCECGVLNVIGSRAELEERATAGLDGLQELHRPWIDDVTIRCESCGRDGVQRIVEVGDAWLDAGIVHFSTLGWKNETWVEHGNATGAAAGLTGADLPDHAYWEKWFPADWVSEMREQIRLWFYSQCFMAVTLVGQSPYRSVLTYEKVYDETGRPMHKSWGNAIELNEALERMGADVARWLFCEQQPSQPLRFGYHMADDVKRRLLTFWNSVSFFVTYANVESFDPGAPAENLRPLDRWLRRADRCSSCATRRDALRALLDAGCRAGVRGVRRRPLELVHPALAAAVLGGRRDGAPRAVGCADDGDPGDLAGDAVPRASTCGGTSCRWTSRSSSRRGRRPARSTTRCSPRSRRCGAWSSSGGRRARQPA